MNSELVRQILSHHSNYYRQLDAMNQRRFEDRLARLLRRLTFEACPSWKRNPLPDSPLDEFWTQIKVVIASAQIQLTFGLKNFLPASYHHITVKPSSYRVINYHRELIGHVDPNQTRIFLSWEHVRYGFDIPDDAVNVALHEFAHWLELENLVLDQDYLCRTEYSLWRLQAAQKLLVVRDRQNEFLKDYSGTNLREMFAVSVEAFFEQSQLFSQQLPHLYAALVELLDQDPINSLHPQKQRNPA